MLEVPYLDSDFEPHCLSRRFESSDILLRLGQSLQPKAVEELLNKPDYESLNLGLESGPHNAIPQSIRGDFSLFTAPSGLLNLRIQTLFAA